MREPKNMRAKDQPTNNTDLESFPQKHKMDNKQKIKDDGLNDNEKMEVNVENIMQNMSKPDKSFSKIKDLLYRGHLGNELAEQVQDKTDPKKLIPMKSLKRYKLCQWPWDFM